MRKVIIIILVLLVVAGGGAGGLVMLGVVRNPFKPKPPEPEMDATAKAAAEADAKAKANAFEAPIAAPPMVKAGDLVIPVLMPNGEHRQVYVTARIVTDATNKAVVQALLPKYVDAVLSDLIPYFQNYLIDHDILDLKVIKKKLIRHAKEIYADGAKDVLLVNVFESGAKSQSKLFRDDD